MKRHTIAHEFRLSLQAGVIDREEIIQWANGIMAMEGYDDAIANICLATHQTDKELESLLSGIDDQPNWDGTRRMLGRMHGALLRQPGRLHEFTQFLERIWIRNGYDVPADIEFIAGIEDDYLLAESGTWSSLEEVRNSLMDSLASFVVKSGAKG